MSSDGSLINPFSDSGPAPHGAGNSDLPETFGEPVQPGRFSELLAGTTLDALIVLDGAGQIQSWNFAAAEVFGRSEPEVVGKQLAELIAPLQEPQPGGVDVQRALDEDWLALIDRRVEAAGLRPDGECFPISVAISRLPSDGPERFAVAVRDLSSVREAESALIEVESQFQTLVEQLPAVVFTDAVDGHFTSLYVSPQIETLLGYTPSEWLADSDLWVHSLHPADRERVVEAAFHGPPGKPFIHEYRLLRRDGETVWVREETVLVRDESGRASTRACSSTSPNASAMKSSCGRPKRAFGRWLSRPLL